MWEVVEFWKQCAQVLFEHRSGDLPIGCPALSVLEHEDQEPVDHEYGKTVFELFGISRISDLSETLEQNREHLSHHLQQPGHGIISACVLLGDAVVV